jgi:hypothetical protein
MGRVLAAIFTYIMDVSVLAATYVCCFVAGLWAALLFWLKHAILEWLEIEHPLSERAPLSQLVTETVVAGVEAMTEASVAGTSVQVASAVKG